MISFLHFLTFVCVCAWGGLPSIVAAATTYYISPTGSDSNAGTSPASPWQTSKPANALVLSPGDAILFQGGVNHTGVGGLVVSSSGSYGSPINVGSYAGAGPAMLFIDGSVEAGVSVVDASYVSISNLCITGTSAALGAAKFSGVNIYASDSATARFEGVSVSDVSVINFQDGLTIGAATCFGFQGVEIVNVSASGNWQTGISSYGSFNSSCISHADVRVTDCNASFNQGNPRKTSGWSGSGIVVSGVDGGVVSRCVASENGASNGHFGGGPFGIWTYDSNNVTTTRCVAHHNHNGFPAGDSNDGGGFDIDGGSTNCLIEHVLSFANDGPGFLVCQFGSNIRPTANNTIRYSVSYNDGGACSNGASGLNFFSPDATLSGTAVVGLTIVGGNTTPPLVAPLNSYSAPFYNTLISSNAFLALGAAGRGAIIDFDVPGGLPGLNFSGNAYWSASVPLDLLYDGASYPTLAAFRKATGQETGAQGQATGSDADPGLLFNTTFFQACVNWDESYPTIPNSPALDALRGFAGC